MMEHGGAETAGGGRACESEGRHAHPEGVAGGGGPGKGKRVEADVDLVVQLEIIVHSCAEVKFEPVRGDAVGGNPGGRGSEFAFAGHGSQEYSRSGHGTEKFRPKRRHFGA